MYLSILIQPFWTTRKRQQDLRELVDRRLHAEPAKSITMGAEFLNVATGWDSFEVR